MIKKIGLQLYSIRESLKTPELAAQTFKKLKELGYDEAQTAGCYGMPYEQFYELANNAGIEIIGTHDDFEMMKNDIDQAIENHKKLHTTNMGIGGFRALTIDAVNEFIEDANKIADRIFEEGMKFTYHNHSHEFLKLENGKTIMEMLAEGLNTKNTSFVLDTYWVQNAGGDVCTWIEKLAGRIDILHLKDMKIVRTDDNKFITDITEIGNGNMDFAKIIDAAQKAGVKYYCVEQDNCPEDFAANIKFSSDYLHKHFMK